VRRAIYSPGGEHGPDQAGGKRWNRGLHKRKFLQVPGDYLTARDGVRHSDDLVFWGEWEPESKVSPITAPVLGGPRFVHLPYYVRPRTYSGDLQNTDPFVYGDQFLYTLCRQTKPIHGHPQPTFLRGLAPGSLILFVHSRVVGSCSTRLSSSPTEHCMMPRAGRSACRIDI